MKNTLNGLRHRTTSVRNMGGYFLNYLQPTTTRATHHLFSNGTERDNTNMFRCRDLNNLVRVTIINPITETQKFAFGRWARRLIDIREEGKSNGGTMPIDSSLSGMPAGTLTRAQRLRLDICIPTGFETLLNIAHNLRHIEFLPGFNPIGPAGIMAYVNQFKTLLAMLGDSEILPSLKLVHALASTDNTHLLTEPQGQYLSGP